MMPPELLLVDADRIVRMARTEQDIFRRDAGLAGNLPDEVGMDAGLDGGNIGNDHGGARRTIVDQQRTDIEGVVDHLVGGRQFADGRRDVDPCRGGAQRALRSEGIWNRARDKARPIRPRTKFHRGSSLNPGRRVDW
jgi:hypothetical protein